MKAKHHLKNKTADPTTKIIKARNAEQKLGNRRSLETPLTTEPLEATQTQPQITTFLKNHHDQNGHQITQGHQSRNIPRRVINAHAEVSIPRTVFGAHA